MSRLLGDEINMNGYPLVAMDMVGQMASFHGA